MFNNFLSIDDNLLYFKKSVVVIFYKLRGKRHYTSTKNYWSIGLLNTLGKIMKVVLANRISYIPITKYF